MEIDTWFSMGIVYLAILFATALASLIPYSLESWLVMSAFLMMIWLIGSLFIDKEEKCQKN